MTLSWPFGDLISRQLGSHDKTLALNRKRAFSPESRIPANTSEATSTCSILHPADFRSSAYYQQRPWSHPRQWLSLGSTVCVFGGGGSNRSRGLSRCGRMRKPAWLVLSGEIKKPPRESGQPAFIWMHYQCPRLDNSLISTTHTLSDNTGEREHVVQRLVN